MSERPTLDAQSDERIQLDDRMIPESPKPSRHRQGPLLTLGLVVLAMIALFAVNLLQMSQPRPEVRPSRSTPSIVSGADLEAQARRQSERDERERQWLLERQTATRRAAEPSPPRLAARQRLSRPRSEVARPAAMPTGLVPAGVSAPRPLTPRVPLTIPPRSQAGWAEVDRKRPDGPVLIAGTFIPAQLATPVSSEASGERVVVAMVSYDVRDATHRHVVIPVGSRLLGRLIGEVRPGRSRAAIVWDRLDLPGGRVFDLAAAPTASPDGGAGVVGEVDHHWRALYAHAFLTSALGGLGRWSQSSDRAIESSSGEIIASGVGSELNRVTTEVADRVLRRPSTVELARGQRIAVLVTRDVVFGGGR